MPLFHFIGVDVGTSSARAALVTENGNIVKAAVEPIRIWNPRPDFYEQSSDDIWAACLKCIKIVTRGINPEEIKGIGFDATCSLVAVDKTGQPLSLSPTGNTEQNVILWMDHRASKETTQINQLKHPVLKFVGKKISIEMETPKLLWIKNNLRDQWNKVDLFFDLPDFLTWKATGCDSRSLCSLVCKWTYEAQSDGTSSYNLSYFKDLGLEDLSEDNWRKIGSMVLPPGTPVGQGICENVANELGLLKGTPVGASIIDAHAGGLGLVGCSVRGVDPSFNSRLSLICGTSTCHMAVSEDPVFVDGIWGPYYSAMVPGMWLNEGGQSAAGKLIDHIIDSHPATSRIQSKIGDKHVQIYLCEVLIELAKREGLKAPDFLSRDVHIWPDFHGNRSPIADPTLKGMISGLTLASDEESLALLYLATVQALSYGTRHILETLVSSGYKNIKSILICGGLSKNLLFVQTQADVVNLPVICPEEAESVLLGAAILGACAANHFKDMSTAIQSMGGKGEVVYPNLNVVDYHNKKYRVFLKMVEHQLEYRAMMN